MNSPQQQAACFGSSPARAMAIQNFGALQHHAGMAALEGRSVSDIYLRLELRDPQQAHAALSGQAWPWVKEQTSAGRPVVGEFRLLEDELTVKQRQPGWCSPNCREGSGAQRSCFPMRCDGVRSEFLGFIVVTATRGRKSVWRIGSEQPKISSA
jgi:hypothetical protein